MADDVTLLPCPMCGGTDIRIARLSASPDQSVWCHSCQLRTKWCYRDDAIALWNTRVPDARVAALEAVERVLADGEITTVGASFASTADAVAETIAELRRRERELAALKARSCDTCKHGRRISDIAYECKPTHGHLVMWAHDGCSRWEQRKKKRGVADG